MNESERPSPDALLASIQAEQAKASRGHLKIFFGMCPGVGKTYAMLSAVRQKLADGCEVVAGIVETHGRPETQALLENLPVLPRMQVEYRGTLLEEFDLDAILVWHPNLVLVDELAHTNIPGSRHPKRYQDVLELLDAGIDVFTTLNVQHIESRTDAVRQITGITVRETVPDSLLDLADEIELIDLTPEQLRQRLGEGKVYLGDRAAAASENFFREGNLMALREMALRLTAEHVDRRLRTLRCATVPDAWRSGDRLLVAVSSNPYSTELIRWTRRYAAGLEAPWMAVSVETSTPLSTESEKRRASNLALARQLGAEVVLTSGIHVGQALLKVAQQHGVTQMILGKPVGTPWRWFVPSRSPVVWLIEHSGNIDIQLLRTQGESREAQEGESLPQPWPQYGFVLALVAGVTAISVIAQGWIGYWSVALIYLLTVMLAGTYLQRRPTFVLAALSALLWNYLFIPPLYTIRISAPQDVMMFFMFFAVAVIVGHLTTRLHERERLGRRREERATALYQLTRALAAADSLEEAVRVIMSQLGKTFKLKAAALLRDESGAFMAESHPASTWSLPAKEEGVAAWVFQNRQAAGRTTDTLPDGAALHLPLLVADRVEGVLSLELVGESILAPEQRELLEAFAAQLAVVAEKERLAAAQRHALVVAASERLQKTLFDSVSHELKTPIATISAALDQGEVDLGELRRANERLRRTVENLLDATRLESGMVKLSQEWCEPAELAMEAIECAGLGSGEVNVEVIGEPPPIRVDASLIQQALATLLLNSSTHGASARPISLVIRRVDRGVQFEVADHGRGLPEGLEEKVFEKFYRVPGSPAGGLGLGLSIARRLAEAHGGSLVAKNRPGGGASFLLCIPIGGELRLPG